MATNPPKLRGRTSAKNNTVRLLRDDKREIQRLSHDFKKPEGEVLRELVHEALRARRLRKAGRDEVTAPSSARYLGGRGARLEPIRRLAAVAG